MRKSLSLLPAAIIALAFVAIPAHAQFDAGTNWKLDQVQNVDFVAGGCTEDMTADQCMTSGYAPGMTSCSAVRCLTCGYDINGKAGCGMAPKGQNGSCKCSTSTYVDPTFSLYVTRCKGEGACTYQG